MKFVLAAAALLLAHAAAAQPLVGPYVSLGAGTNLQQNEIVTPAPLPGSLAYSYRFHPGFAGQASIGYGFGWGFRAELEGLFLDNVVRSFGSTPRPRAAGGTEQKYGGFLNVIHDFDLGLPITPYLGLGAGGLVVAQHNVHQSIPGFPIYNPPPPGFVGNPRDETVGAFAYQGIAGVSLPLPFLPGLSFTTEYRFVGLLDPFPAFRRTLLQDTTIVRPIIAGTLVTPQPITIQPLPRGGVGLPGFVPVTNYYSLNRHFENNFNHTLMLGFRYAFWQPAPPPAPAPPAPVVAPAPAPARTYLVFFDWDRADLTPRARQIIAEAAQASTRVQTTRIEVNGYTDLSGTAAYNQKLSVRRARSVEAELVRDGVPQGEIEIHGYGENNPLVPTAKGVREPQNRRVEILLH